MDLSYFSRAVFKYCKYSYGWNIPRTTFRMLNKKKEKNSLPVPMETKRATCKSNNQCHYFFSRFRNQNPIDQNPVNWNHCGCELSMKRRARFRCVFDGTFVGTMTNIVVLDDGLPVEFTAIFLGAGLSRRHWRDTASSMPRRRCFSQFSTFNPRDRSAVPRNNPRKHRRGGNCTASYIVLRRNGSDLRFHVFFACSTEKWWTEFIRGSEFTRQKLARLVFTRLVNKRITVSGLVLTDWQRR